MREKYSSLLARDERSPQAWLRAFQIPYIGGFLPKYGAANIAAATQRNDIHVRYSKSRPVLPTGRAARQANCSLFGRPWGDGKCHLPDISLIVCPMNSVAQVCRPRAHGVVAPCGLTAPLSMSKASWFSITDIRKEMWFLYR